MTMPQPKMPAMPESYARLNAAANAVREYADTDAAKAVVTLLKALEVMYDEDLRRVEPEGLRARQAARHQVEQLRSLMQGAQTNARI